MEYFNSLVCSVHTMSIGKDMKVSPAYEGDLKKREKYLICFVTDTTLFMSRPATNKKARPTAIYLDKSLL